MPGAEHVVLPYPDYDIQDLTQVADGEFDFMILDQTLEHLQNPEKALSEVHRVLKPGGVAIISTPFLIPVHPGKNYGDYYRWTPQGMKVVLERCGFEPEVHMWGNLKAAQALLGKMYMLANEAKRRRLDVSTAFCDERFPVSVWATARARK